MAGQNYSTDVVYKLQTSKKLGVKRFGPFKILQLIGKNAIRLAPPTTVHAHDVVHVEHTKEFIEQPAEISGERPKVAELHLDNNGEQVINIVTILAHKVKRHQYYFLVLPRNAPTHHAAWQPLRDFVDNDGTITEALHIYIVDHQILQNLH